MSSVYVVRPFGGTLLLAPSLFIPASETMVPAAGAPDTVTVAPAAVTAPVSHAYTVVIDETPVFVKAGTLLIDSTIGKRSTASFTVYDGTGRMHYQQYQQVMIYDQSGALAFSGYVDQPKEQKPGFQPSLETQITCIDQHFLADKRVVAAAYTNKTTGFIAQDMLNTILAQEGVTIGLIYDGILPGTTTYPGVTLYPGGNVGPIPSAEFRYTTVAQALDELVKQASNAGVPYYWQIDQKKQLYFCPYDAVVNSTVLDGTQIDQVGTPPTVTRHNPSYRNTQYVVGGTAQTQPQTKTILGDGHTSSWPMDYAIASITSVTLNGAAVPVGKKGSTGSSYYWTQGDPILAQDTGTTKLLTTDTLIVTYIGQYPNVSITQNGAQVTYQASLDATTGIVEAVEQNTTVTTADNGMSVASQLLNRYGVQATLFEGTTMQAGYAQGQLITVNVPPFGLNSVQMLIESVSASDQQDGYNLWYTLKCVVGPYDTTWQDFFSSLLKQQVSASNISVGVSQSLTLFAQFNTTINVVASLSMSTNVFTVPIPSTTLYPSLTLYPGA